MPSSAGTHGPGQEKAPAALRAAGLVDRLEAAGIPVTDHGDLPVEPFRADRERRNRQNVDRVAAVVRSVSVALRPLLDAPALPVLIGGDCTITLGAMAALVDKWPDAGLLYFDGDLDLSTPDSTVSGVLDTMVLAHLLGEGTPELEAPVLAVDRIEAFGHDPRELGPASRERLARHGLRTTACTEVTEANARELAARAWTRLGSGQVLLHFDVDVVDSVDFPLANFPHFNECLPERVAMDCLAEFCSSPGLAALVVTEVNPDRDPDGVLVDRLVGHLVNALT
ncbi:arginase [Actinocrispum wychmicini]|uniref:Arginase n=1 Tax=Actinocrispum wychmicini TaxID=1213861 RepID=A0A4V2S6G1_9PSEU|nr:arginase [Actinocrispum wychmicini]